MTDSLILFFPKMTESIIKVIETNWDMQIFRSRIITFVIVVIVFVILDRIFLLITKRCSSKLVIYKQRYYRKKYLEMDYHHIMELWTGKAIARIEKWSVAEWQIFFSFMNIFVHTFYRGTILFVIIFMNEWVLWVAVLLSFIIVFSLNIIFYKKLKPVTEEINTLDEDTTRNIVRIVMEHLLIKITNKSKMELKNSKQLLSKYPKLELKADFLQRTFYDILHMLIRLVEILIYALVGLLIMKWEAQISYMFLLIWYLRFFRYPIDSAVSGLANINRQMAYYKKLQKFINLPKTIVNGKKKFKKSKGNIEFKNIDFWYKKEKSIFKDFSIEFEWGKTTALVGHSWSWKTTIVKLILRLFDIKKWNILIDNQELKKLNLESFYRHVWYLSQEPAVFDWTIRENLEYALSDKIKSYNDKILRDSLKKSEAYDLVKNMKDWLETQIGERGVKLSWWEKQRIAIARIFLKNPEILILDEPTSALDSVSESKITKVLKAMMKNRTVIVVAHRLQTVQHSDKIVVLEKWKIIEIWSHDELINNKWIYSTLVDLQSGRIAE